MNVVYLLLIPSQNSKTVKDIAITYIFQIIFFVMDDKRLFCSDSSNVLKNYYLNYQGTIRLKIRGIKCNTFEFWIINPRTP